MSDNYVGLDDAVHHGLTLEVEAKPGQWLMFSTCCDTVHIENREQVAALRDALTRWLDTP